MPDPPKIDAKKMFWTMMRVSREPDPWMYPALKKLREDGRYVLAALSNTVIFPEGVRDEEGKVFESGLRFPDPEAGETKGVEGGTGAEIVPQTERGGDAGHAQIRELFDVFVSSAHVGLRKPDPRMYELAMGRIREVALRKRAGDVRPENVVFLDDIGENLKGGRKIGFRTVKVNLGRTIEAVRELEDITGLKLVDDKAKL